MPSGMWFATSVGNADAEIDVEPVLQFARRAGRHFVACPGHVRSPLRPLRRACARCAARSACARCTSCTMRLTKMPGVMMWSASISPGSTSSSTSATVTSRRRRHDRIEIARGLAVDEVALGIGLPGVHDREIGDQAAFHDVLLAVELAHFLALGDLRADAGAGEERRDAGAAGADALGQRALRVELDLQLAGEVLAGERLVFADIGADHLADLPGLQQQAEAGVVDAGVVAR